MTLTIELSPQEEAWIAAQSVQQGLPPDEVVKQWIDSQLPATPAPMAAPQVQEPQVLDAGQTAAMALLDSWIVEGVAADEQTRCQAEEELAEFKRNMNANRAATGERLVYP